MRKLEYVDEMEIMRRDLALRRREAYREQAAAARAARTAAAAAEEASTVTYQLSNVVVDGVPPGGEEDYADLRTAGWTPLDVRHAIGI